MLDRLVEELEKGNVVVLTGAGISVESGIPDFRGPKGLWKRVSPDVFSISEFYRDPYSSWVEYAKLYESMARAEPNLAHRVLAALERDGYVRAVITQNIDGLHQKAGSEEVVELHGNGGRAVCLECGSKVRIEDALKQVREGRVPRHECGGLLKPDVVYFGEPLPPKELEEAVRLSKSSRLFVVIGSSLVVSPACDLPVIAKGSGAKLAILNLEPTRLDGMADFVIRGKATGLMKEISEKLRLKI